LWWRITSNVSARMNSLNPKNDLRFSKIKEAVKLKMISVDYYFTPTKH